MSASAETIRTSSRHVLESLVEQRGDGTVAVTIVFPSGGDTDDLVRRMLASVPDVSLFEEKVGPLYSTSSLRRWLQLSRQGIDGHVKRRNILALKLSDGVRAYPAWQFGPDGSLLPGLAEVSKVLDPTGRDPLAVALALGNKSEAFGGHTGAELLRAGDLDTVLSAVSRAARALAS